MIDTEDVVRRLDRREGFHVVSYKEIGLPVFRMNCAFTLQETSNIGAIEEFTLRAIAQGVDTSSDLERFLGLPAKVVASQIGQSCYDLLVAPRTEDPTRHALTTAGKRYLSEASTEQFVRQRLPVYMDGITRKLVAVQTQDLWRAEDLENQGFACIVPGRRQFPKPSEIDLIQVNRIVSTVASADGPKRRAIRLDAVIGRTNLHFQRALAIVFKSADGKRISIGFAIDGIASMEHEIEYERSGAARRSALFGALFDPDKRRREAQAVARELRQDMPAIRPPTDGASSRPILSLPKASTIAVSEARVRVLSVYEHPPLLRSALERAATRLLLISPWIRANVVNDDFMRLLTACVSRGVRVTIAYGIGKRDPDERHADKVAREALEALTGSFQNFSLVRKGNTHAKVLLVDDAYFVTTSFNWLSFRGDPSQPMREEEGTLVEDPAAVNAYYDQLMRRMEAMGSGKP